MVDTAIEKEIKRLEASRGPWSLSLSPDGTQIVYVRNFMDVMSDASRSNLWLIDVASGEQRPITSDGEYHITHPRCVRIP